MTGIKYISWADTTGYASTAKAYIRALVDAGEQVTWTPMMYGRKGYQVARRYRSDCPQLAPLVHRDCDYDSVLIQCVPELFPPFIEQERAHGKRILGVTVWEHDDLPMHWPPILNQLDGVIVPCEWNRQSFQRSGVTVPIYVVPYLPHAADIEPDANDLLWWQRKLAKRSQRQPSTIFYNIAFWNQRKAPSLALEAFLSAFSAEDDVALVLKTTRINVTQPIYPWWALFRMRFENPETTVAKRLARYRQETGREPPTVLTVADERLDDGKIAALHQFGNIFFSTTHSEGWGMGAYDAALLGKPVSMPNYGGQMDFLTAQHPLWLPATMVEVPNEAWPHPDKPKDRWAEVDLDAASQLLRKLHTDMAFRQEQLAYAKTHATWITTQFSTAKVVEAMRNAIEGTHAN